MDDRERGLEEGGLTWRRPGVGGEERKEKRKVEKYLISWATNLQPAQPLALSSLVHWAVTLHSGLCHPQVRIESPGHPTVRCGWSRPGCPPPPPKAPISALELTGREQRAYVGVGGHPGRFAKLWLAKPFLLWFPGERKAICKTRQQPEVDCSD